MAGDLTFKKNEIGGSWVMTGYPQIILLILGFSPELNHPAIGLPPWRAGNPHVVVPDAMTSDAAVLQQSRLSSPIRSGDPLTGWVWLIGWLVLATSHTQSGSRGNDPVATISQHLPNRWTKQPAWFRGRTNHAHLFPRISLMSFPVAID